MYVLFIKYNKPHNDSIETIKQYCKHEIIDILSISKSIDNISYHVLCNYFNSLHYFRNITHIVIGDIFWPTGQNICKLGIEYNKKIVFLQHGQWIYLDNKKNPEFLPYLTCFYGNYIKKIAEKWNYGLRSKCEVTGSPKYDNIQTEEGDYFYFCPPMILEKFPSRNSILNIDNKKLLVSMLGLDKYCKLVIHPHYREGDINFIKGLFPLAKIVDAGLNSLDLIRKSKGVITHRDSTTVIDAICCKKQSLLLNFNNQKQSFFKKFYFKDYCIENNDFADLINNIEKVEVIKEHYVYVDDYIQQGDASSKILNLMENN